MMFQKPKGIDVYIIAGQSNASGYTRYSDTIMENLWPDYQTGHPNVLYNGRAEYTIDCNTPFVSTGANEFNTWTPARAGMGIGSEYMGAEVGMASYLSKTYYSLSNQDREAGIIKFAHGGTSLLNTYAGENAASGNWVSPTYAQSLGAMYTGLTGGLYRGLLERLLTGVSSLKDSGYTDIAVKSIFWMQGESDVENPDEYERAFTFFAQDIRTDICQITGTDTSDLPIILGEISKTSGSSESTHVDKNMRFVMMQKKLSKTVRNVYSIPSSKFEINRMDENAENRNDGDPWHWNTTHMFTIGELVGECIVNDILHNK